MNKEPVQQIGKFLKNASQFFALFLLYSLVRGIGESRLTELGGYIFYSLMFTGGVVVFSSLIFYLIVGTYSFTVNYGLVIFFFLVVLFLFEVLFIK